jgi:hypothetical protein
MSVAYLRGSGWSSLEIKDTPPKGTHNNWQKMNVLSAFPLATHFASKKGLSG